jgi:hypothetical protein
MNFEKLRTDDILDDTLDSLINLEKILIKELNEAIIANDWNEICGNILLDLNAVRYQIKMIGNREQRKENMMPADVIKIYRKIRREANE